MREKDVERMEVNDELVYGTSLGGTVESAGSKTIVRGGGEERADMRGAGGADALAGLAGWRVVLQAS